jgi:adenylosuccinate synthase
VGPERLGLSEKAHIIMPYHKAVDLAREEAKGKEKIGTTGRGIGPCYEDKAGRTGIRAIDLTEGEALKKKVGTCLKEKNFYLERFLGGKALDAEAVLTESLGFGQKLSPFLCDVSLELEEAVQDGRNVLFEGAQGTHLDIDHGTYPYVTSSSPVAGAACTGAGIGPGQLHHIVGVVKAYTTRVGAGPFATELADETGDFIQERGMEFGATTGRRRRCGWLDLVVLRDSARLNGLNSLAITKLDVLTGLETLRVCIGYELEGRGIPSRPASLERFAECVPVYRELPGWQEDISGVRRLENLPVHARAYLDLIQEETGVPLSIVSVGAGREETIMIRNPFHST